MCHTYLGGNEQAMFYRRTNNLSSKTLTGTIFLENLVMYQVVIWAEKFTTIPPVGMPMLVEEALPMEVVKGATKQAPQDDSGSGTK